MVSRLLSLALGLSALAAPARAADADADVDCTGVKAISPRCASAETGYRRDFFYVGGETVATAKGNITAHQLYVEKLSPLGGATHAHPLVFFHGGGFSGTTWLNTPDNRPGFASYFVGQGYQVYLVDFNSVGRSAAVDPATFPAAGVTTVEVLEVGFTAVAEFGAYPQARLHTQWPGTGQRGDDAVFEQFRREPLPYTSNTTALETAVRRSGCALLALLGRPSYLVNHSMGGTAGILLSNDCPELVAANVNLEAATVPFSWPNVGLGSTRTRAWGLTATPLDYDPPVADAADLAVVAVGNESLALRACYRQAEPARRLPRLAAVPYLLVTGEASVHITFDHCIVDYLEQVGARPEWIKLADRGIKGNGHFMHVELNNLEIAKVVQDWMESKGN